MTNWYRVFHKLKGLCPEHLKTLEEVLTYIYIEKAYSLSKIVSLIPEEIRSPITLRNKLKTYNISIKTRGGDNCSKELPLQIEDFVKCSARELAKKHNVHITTIYNRKKSLGL